VAKKKSARKEAGGRHFMQERETVYKYSFTLLGGVKCLWTEAKKNWGRKKKRTPAKPSSATALRNLTKLLAYN